MPMPDLFRYSRRLAIVLALLAPLAACAMDGAGNAAQPVSDARPAMFPANGATNVNPDTQLVLTFASPPAVGKSGVIRIHDAADNSLVDTIDLGIPFSPNPSGRSSATTEAERRAQGASTNMADFQVNTIAGVDFHFHPVLVRGAKATISPHNGKLKYGRKYVVTMDASVLAPAGSAFGGIADTQWTFTTKAAPPKPDATRVVVDAGGRGDFNTVQGALDFVPAKPAKRVTIFVRNGRYEELVYLSGKSDITLRGESRDKVEVTYPNNSAFNPPKGSGPSRRPAFSIQNSNGIQLSTFTITNTFIGQAEALLVRGERNIIDRMTLNGSGDALTTYGTLYMADSKLIGHGDTILGYAALYCLRCEIHSIGPFTWTRTPQGGHGNVFVDSTFVVTDAPLPWTVTTANPAGQRSKAVFARLPKNGPTGAPGANFPYAEMVLINAKTKNVPPEGWGPVEDPPEFDSSNVHFWEFNTTDTDGKPIDVSSRHPIVKQLTLPKDADTIANYRKPEFVLGGWKPAVE